MILFDRTGAADQTFDVEQARLIALLSDLEQIREGILPEGLATEAPLLDRWLIAQRSAPCLVGLSTGHPLLPGAGRKIVTSEIQLMSRDREWARTSSRWYRLGRPAVKARRAS